MEYRPLIHISGVLPIVEAVGRNELILLNIFRYLNGHDLKTCRLVNKKWNSVAKGPFKKRMTVRFEENAFNVSTIVAGFFPRIESVYPLYSTPNFITYFQCAEEKFVLNSFDFYFENGLFRDPVDLEFLIRFGRDIKRLAVRVDQKNQKIPVEELIKFRNRVLEYLPNVEELSIKSYVYLENNFSVSNAITSMTGLACSDVSNLALKNLKTLKFYLRSVGRNSVPKADREELIKTVFFSIINNANNLECIAMNTFGAKIEALLKISTEALKKLKELRLNDWKCNDIDIRRSLKMLTDLGRHGNFKLHSFTVEFRLKYCRHFYLREVIRLLLGFITSQKDNLKILRIKISQFDEANFPYTWILEGPMIFPQMNELEIFELSHSREDLMPFFANDESWAELFPQLKEFQYTCLLDAQKSIIPTLIENMTTPCLTATKITLNMKLYDHPDQPATLTPLFVRNVFPCIYMAMQRKFPNINTFKMDHHKLNMVYMSTSEDIRDIVMYRNQCPGDGTTKRFVQYPTHGIIKIRPTVEEFNNDSDTDADDNDRHRDDFLLMQDGPLDMDAEIPDDNEEVNIDDDSDEDEGDDESDEDEGDDDAPGYEDGDLQLQEQVETSSDEDENGDVIGDENRNIFPFNRNIEENVRPLRVGGSSSTTPVLYIHVSAIQNEHIEHVHHESEDHDVAEEGIVEDVDVGEEGIVEDVDVGEEGIVEDVDNQQDHEQAVNANENEGNRPYKIHKIQLSKNNGLRTVSGDYSNAEQTGHYHAPNGNIERVGNEHEGDGGVAGGIVQDVDRQDHDQGNRPYHRILVRRPINITQVFAPHNECPRDPNNLN